MKPFLFFFHHYSKINQSKAIEALSKVIFNSEGKPMAPCTICIYCNQNTLLTIAQANWSLLSLAEISCFLATPVQPRKVLLSQPQGVAFCLRFLRPLNSQETRNVFTQSVLSCVAWIFNHVTPQVVQMIKGFCQKWTNHIYFHQR